jgi:tetratricopeptide (TPR) repeat protein
MKSPNVSCSGPDESSPAAEQPPGHWGARPAEDGRNRRQTWLISLGLALAVLAAYGQLWDCDFVAWDDGNYVTANSMVKQGLSRAGVVWAFSTFRASNWHPLTWISHEADYQLYAMNPAGHHFTSLLLHLANSILLFLLLRRMTRAQWPSALAAALFAVHPLHVESVAWISERKDVLSGFFWMLTVWAYVRYAEEFKIQNSKFKIYYALALFFFALGLMSKPMLVTLPFVLILFDYWPLRRGWQAGIFHIPGGTSPTLEGRAVLPRRPELGRSSSFALPDYEISGRPSSRRRLDAARLGSWRLVLEKIPFFILAAAASVVAFMAQRQGGAVASLAALPMGARLGNIPVAYARYVGKTLWPVHLAVFYPMPPRWPDWEVGGSILLLALATIWAVWRVRAQPYLAVGWFWFLGMLAPVIGLVQIGWQSMADRYDYIPGIGLSVMVLWAASEWTPRRGGVAAVAARRSLALPRAGVAAVVLGWLAVAGCVAATRVQVGYWTNSETLFRHAVETTPGNGFLESSLGRALFLEGRREEAMPHLRQGAALAYGNAGVHYNLGNAFLALGRVPEAVEQFEIAVNLAPEDAVNQFTLGAALLKNGRAEAALGPLEAALRILPGDVDSHCELAAALLQTGRARSALGEYEKALQIQPDSLPANASLAWILASNPDASLRDGARAVSLALRADQLSGGQNPFVAAALGAAYAEVGDFSQAVAAAQRALQIPGQESRSPLAATVREQLALYRTGSPFRDTSPAGLPAAALDN